MHGGHVPQRLGGVDELWSGHPRSHRETRVPLGERGVQAGMVVAVALIGKAIDVVHAPFIPALERGELRRAGHDTVAVILPQPPAANNRIVDVQMSIQPGHKARGRGVRREPQGFDDVQV